MDRANYLIVFRTFPPDKMAKTFLLFVLFFLQITFIHAQTRVGVMLIAEDANDNVSLRPSVGLVIDHQVTRKSGIETGIFYRTFLGTILVFTELNGLSNTFFVDVRESHITLPILYKFHSRILNLSVGPTFDFFMGWKQTGGSQEVEVNDYSISPSFGFGGMLKVSKSIRLSDRMYLEPDLRLNPVLSRSIIYGGFGIAIKYQTKQVEK